MIIVIAITRADINFHPTSSHNCGLPNIGHNLDSSQANSLLSEPTLLLRRGFGFRDFSLREEFIRRVVIPNIPEILRHWDDERTNNKHCNQSGIFSWISQRAMESRSNETKANEEASNHGRDLTLFRFRFLGTFVG